jgi:hypothetical protein
MKPFVSINCQTAGLATALRATTEALRAKLQQQMQGAHAFVYSQNNTLHANWHPRQEQVRFCSALRSTTRAYQTP